MKSNCFCVVTAVSALVLAGTVARAESDAEHGNRAPATPASLTSPWSAGQPATEQARPAVRAAPRPAMFAPAAAANAKRMSAQQLEERQFLKDAAASSRFEAEASRLALGKSHDAGVRSIAATLINHHAAVGNELLHMLHARRMAAPMLANHQRKILNRLAKLQGAKFDREFLENVALRSQEEGIARYEKASLVANDAHLKAWIDWKLPTLRYHLATAERTAPAGVKLASGSQVPARLPNRSVARSSLATRSMGAGPAAQRSKPSGSAQAGTQDGMLFGGVQYGGDAQLGATRSISARPNESSSR
jgi:predicted outer membrane protein